MIFLINGDGTSPFSEYFVLRLLPSIFSKQITDPKMRKLLLSAVFSASSSYDMKHSGKN